MRILSYSPFGYEGSIVEVEVDLRRGIPAVDIVGLADSAVKESRERMKAAIKNSGFDFPDERVLISLSPADLKKEGGGFDLPIALAVLKEKYSDNMPRAVDDAVLVMGELELSGGVRNVRGVYAALQTAVKQGIEYAIVPHSANLEVPKGIKVQTVGSLEESWDALCKIGEELDVEEQVSDEKQTIEFSEVNEEIESDFDNMRQDLKYAMAVAVAGRHNILAYGAVGCGKIFAFQHFPYLMPKLHKIEKEEVKRIYSIAGMDGVVTDKRPFRQPHQTASIEGMYGGGVNCRPGEVTLAHNGMLFLDEAAEFRGAVLQMLRVPLESGSITLARAGRSTVYPSKFMLAMTTNPCPCGNHGHKDKICRCSAKSIEMYWRKFSAPLIDRIAIRFNCNESECETIGVDNYSLGCLKKMIKGAWEAQLKRQGKLNNDLNPQEVSTFCKIDEPAQKKLEEWATNTDASTRAISNVLKLARTLADINGRKKIDLFHIEDAIKLFGKLPDIVTF